MIKIRTKLLIYFVVVLSLILILFQIREQSDQKVTELHNESLDHFFLLNEITQKTNETFQSLQIYVQDPLAENLAYYQKDKEALISLQEEFAALEKQGVPRKNFLNMMTSFLEQADQTVEGVNNQDVQQYSTYLNEAENTSSYIHEETLDLINMELTEYQDLFFLANERIESARNMGTAIFVSVIILSIAFALWFSNGITRTIERLTGAAREISAGKYTGEDVIVSRKDELWILTDIFNQMKKNVLQSVNEIEEKARLAQLLKEMELKSLQNQINPHFLFNTLNTISKTSYIEGAERTSDLISAVSALLRYNIGNIDRETSLRDEVKIVKEYFFIQKTRFGDRVEFREVIDPDCLSIPLPCLTLQPIIENAFMHGIEGMAEGARIELHIYQKQETVYIEVRDNGTGMDQQTIDRLLNPSSKEEVTRERKSSGHSTGIGMRNVVTRLKLYDKKSRLSIDSKPGHGTTIRIQLSRHQEVNGQEVGERYDKNHACG